jgi:enoyl-CoA hydratase
MPSLELKASEGIATVTFNRPEAMNALNREVLQAFRKMVDDLAHRKDVGVAILTGAGEKAFIAGADIAEMKGMTPLQASEFASLGQEILFGLERLPQVTIAAVNGFALGGGCEVAMGCDLVYASETAKFGQPEVNLGVIPGFGGTQRLMRAVGPIKAREMVFTGGMIDAREAHRIGLAANVFPKEKLMEEVAAVAKMILTKGPEAIRRAKAAMRDGMDTDLRKACAAEREHFALCFAHADQKEGMSAFLEKRKAAWGKGA